MILPLNNIDERALITDIVSGDYRTAVIFDKYDIDYRNGNTWPLKTACEMKGLNTAVVKEELEASVRAVQVSGTLPFNEWPLDFLTDYIVYVHHGYLRQAFSALNNLFEKFINEPGKKFPDLEELEQLVSKLGRNLPIYMKQEEEVIFPYIKQVHRAYYGKDSFAGLLTRTLRKPVEIMMDQEHQTAIAILERIRELTSNYTLPDKPSRRHWILFMQLHELDNDLVQHIFLESKIILPKVLAIENELKNK